MIVHMARLRIAGPVDRLDATLRLLQDAEVVHLARPPVPPATEAHSAGAERAHLGRVLGNVEAALKALGDAPAANAPACAEPPSSLPRAALHSGRVRREAERLARSLSATRDERALLLRYREFFAAFGSLLARELEWPDARAFYVVLRAGARDAVTQLRRSLEEALQGQIELFARPLESGETAVLLLTPASTAGRVGRLLADARVDELPAPPGMGETSLAHAIPALEGRLRQLAADEAATEWRRAALRDAEATALVGLRAWLHDRLLVLDARAQAHRGSYLFVLEGWVPRPELGPLVERAHRELGPEVLVEAVAVEPWMRRDAPVALSNPPIFRPFEIVTRMLPLPRYGTIDPTPFVAVFFPMFFGLMLGDVGYGLLLVALAVVVRLGSRPGTARRSASDVGLACAAFSAGFGFFFGELFGDLGRRALGMRSHGFDRESAIVPFVALAAALGVVHVVLGLLLGAVNAWRYGERRHALGRGVAAVMVSVTVLALLVALRVLPSVLFTPLVVSLLVAFPVLVLLEGIVAVVELVGNLGQILSYVRIMAIGTASLMLAVVANRMAGAMGSVLVGVLFALLFHAVNFAIGVFSPTIHGLRLHYVEFFGRFFSAGGTAYRPLAHWHPSDQRT